MRKLFADGSSFFSLGIATVAYFASIRLLQDALYGRFGIDTGERGLFESFRKANLVQPEPLETLLYLLGFIAIPIIAWTLHWLWAFYLRRLYKKYRRCLYAGFFLTGIALFAIFFDKTVTAIPNLSMYREYVKTHGILHALWLVVTKRLFFLRTLVAVTGVMGIIFFHCCPDRLHLDGFRKAFHRRLLPSIFEAIFILFIGFLVFHPNFPTDTHHYNYFLGPVNDVLHGKALLYETTQLYGMLDVYFLAFLFSHIFPLSYSYFSLILFLLFFFYYGAVYFFLRTWLSSRLLAVLGTLSIVGMTYFAHASPTVSVYFFPAGTPLRFGFEIIIFFCIYFFFRTQKWHWRQASIFLSVLSLFWIFDNGVYLAVATFLAYAIADLAEHHASLSEKIKILRTLLSAYAVYFMAIFSVVNIINYVLFGAWPRWLFMAREILPFLGGGVGMFPLPAIGLFEIFIFIYFLAIFLVLWELQKRGRIPLPLLFITLYGIFSLNYYIGRSIWQNLPIVSVPSIFILLYAFHYLWQGTGIDALPAAWRRIIISSFLSLVFFSSVLLAVKIPIVFARRDYSKATESLTEVPRAAMALFRDARDIIGMYPEMARIPLIHLQDTKMLIFAGRANYFDFYYIDNLYYKSSMQRIIDDVRRRKPFLIFIGKKKNDQIQYFKDGIDDLYRPAKSLRTVEIWESAG